MKQALLKITGDVQGVFYRAHSQDRAIILGLTGFVKNMPDGSVEVLVQGEETDINDFVKWSREGSPSSKVKDIQVEWQNPTEKMENFEIRY